MREDSGLRPYIEGNREITIRPYVDHRLAVPESVRESESRVAMAFILIPAIIIFILVALA